MTGCEECRRWELFLEQRSMSGMETPTTFWLSHVPFPRRSAQIGHFLAIACFGDTIVKVSKSKPDCILAQDPSRNLHNDE